MPRRRLTGTAKSFHVLDAHGSVAEKLLVELRSRDSVLGLLALHGVTGWRAYVAQQEEHRTYTMRHAEVKMPPHKRTSEHERVGTDQENGRPIILLLFFLSLLVALLALVGMDDQRGAILMLAAAVVYAAIRVAQ
jgi:hypothetical protein